jgi:hypothetical protein
MSNVEIIKKRIKQQYIDPRQLFNLVTWVNRLKASYMKKPRNLIPSKSNTE